MLTTERQNFYNARLCAPLTDLPMITLQNLSLFQGATALIRDSSIAIYQGQKVGVIGRNGCGKSTLFKLLMGEMVPDGGELLMPERLARAQMKQETASSTRSALDYVLDGHARFREVERALDDAQERDDHAAMVVQLGELEELDGYNLPNRAEQLLSGLGFSPAEFGKTVAEFSGGWRIRLNLAQALMQPSELLLLDEPTNHLDLEATLWLRQWLLRYRGTVLLISHDRQFLDEVVDNIISFENLKLIAYRGNYSAYERQKAERLAQQQSAYEKQQLRKAEIEDFVRRFRAKATKAKQAQSRLKELQRMVDIEPAHIDSPFQFRFREAKRWPDTVLSCENLAVGYERPLFDGFNYTITGGVRIGLLGPNGQGKSTLLKTLVGQLPALEGKQHRADHLALGYCAQQQTDVLDQDATPLQLMQRLDPKVPEQELRNFLGSFAFRGEQVDTVIRPFSGGEKSRLALALVAWQRPNLLLMDEPTNHLDLEMVHALTRALQDYQGALILVSHDRHLLNNTVDQFLLVRGGKVEIFEGSLEDYERLVVDSRTNEDKLSKNPTSNTGGADKGVDKKEQRQQSAQRRAELKPLRDKIRKLEQQLEKDQTRLRTLGERLADPSLYDDTNKAALAKLMQEQGDLKRRVADTEEAWLLASDELERLKGE
ncbi:MAG TPA: ATP-binding cassette domain-containing protein [Hyphomicrobiales bacterium]|nr:ATP-binding cassette domain-containing protein [Hyphomicrobiales bacterium]